MAGLVRRYTAETIASLTGYAYLVEAIHALQFREMVLHAGYVTSDVGIRSTACGVYQDSARQARTAACPRPHDLYDSA